jgi:hypothetical protein
MYVNQFAMRSGGRVNFMMHRLDAPSSFIVVLIVFRAGIAQTLWSFG